MRVRVAELESKLAEKSLNTTNDQIDHLVTFPMSSGKSLFQNKPKQNELRKIEKQQTRNLTMHKSGYEASSIELIMPGGGKKHIFNDSQIEQNSAASRLFSGKARAMQSNILSKTVENTPDLNNYYCVSQ